MPPLILTLRALPAHTSRTKSTLTQSTTSTSNSTYLDNHRAVMSSPTVGAPLPTSSPSSEVMPSPERTSRKRPREDAEEERRLLQKLAFERGPEKRRKKKPATLLVYDTVKEANKAVNDDYIAHRELYNGTYTRLEQIDKEFMEAERRLDEFAAKHGLPRKPVKAHHDVSELPKTAKELREVFPRYGAEKPTKGHPYKAVLNKLHTHWELQHQNALETWRKETEQAMKARERSESEQAASQNEKTGTPVSPEAHTPLGSSRNEPLVSVLENSEDFDDLFAQGIAELNELEESDDGLDDLFEESETKAKPDPAWCNEYLARMEVPVPLPMEELLDDPFAQWLLHDEREVRIKWKMDGPCDKYLTPEQGDAFLASLFEGMP